MEIQRSLFIKITRALASALVIDASYILGAAITSSNSTNLLSPILQGCLIILFALILLIGLCQSKLSVAWIGWVGLTLVSLFFLFGIGALLLPIN
jgi:hypothetical protein